MNINAENAFFRSAEGPQNLERPNVESQMTKIRHSTFDIRHLAVVGLVFLLGPLGSLAHAAALSWDPGASAGTAVGGSGVWDAASWWNGSEGSWVPSSDAYFGGTAGTVSLVDPVTANNLFFGTSGYLVSGNTLTLNGGTVNVATGSSATINSRIAGSGNSGLTLTGAGALVLNGPAAYTGPTAVNGGTLLINNTDATSGGSVGPAYGSGRRGQRCQLDRNAGFLVNNNWGLIAGFGGTGSLTVGGLNFKQNASPRSMISIIIPTISDATSAPAVDVIGNLTCLGPTKVTFFLNGTLSGSGSIPLLYAGSGISSSNMDAQSSTPRIFPAAAASASASTPLQAILT